MQRKILLPISHGVELGLEDGYCEEFIAKVMKKVPDIYRDFIIPYAFNWNILVDDREHRTYEIEEHLGAKRLRYAAVMIACDILWYKASKGTTGGMDIYTQIHKKLEKELDLLMDKHGDCAVVACGHSWGSQVMLDHAFESKHLIGGLITMGSPVTKVSGMYPDWGHLPPNLDFWINFVAWRDLVASDFKNHPSQQFRDKIEDVNIWSWNPIDLLLLKQHMMYWKNTTVHKKIADALVKYFLRINV